MGFWSKHLTLYLTSDAPTFRRRLQSEMQSSMNLLKGLLKALRIQTNSSGQLLKCVLLNTALELSMCDQSVSGSEILGPVQYEPNHWRSSYKDMNASERLSTAHLPQMLPSPPKPSRVVQQDTENPKTSDVPSAVKCFPLSLPKEDLCDSSSVATTLERPCTVSDPGTLNGNTPARESMVCCRNWSPLTLQIRILQNGECSQPATLLLESSTPPQKNTLKCGGLHSSCTTRSSCWSFPSTNLTPQAMGTPVQETPVNAKYPVKSVSNSRSIESPSCQDCVKTPIIQHDRGVQTDPLSAKRLSLYTLNSEQEKDPSFCGMSQKQDLDSKQSILWDSYDLHLSRSLLNGTQSWLHDWATRGQGELCDIEKMDLKAGSLMKLGQAKKGQEFKENKRYMKHCPTCNIYKTPTSQKLTKLHRRAARMGLYSSTPNRKATKLRRRSTAQIFFPSVQEETCLINETNGPPLEYSDLSWKMI